MFLQEYEKIRQIGKGAFASVYKIRHSKLGYIRALKVCNDFVEDENDHAWQTFVSECKVLLRIGNGSHPNIVRIYQPRLLDNRAVVEMDCVEGDSLSDYIRETRFVPLTEFYRFAKQIIGAVAYCHVDVYKFLMDPVEDSLDIDPSDGRKYIVSPDKEKELIRKYGVVHNDLHSSNIIRRDYDGQYVLLDFGLAIQDAHCVKSSSRFDGAIEYCAPEKLERGEVSARSDVYALGILLYEMLAGRVPFQYNNSDGSSPESARSRVYMQHLKEVPPPIFEFRKQAWQATHDGEDFEQDYPDWLEELIMKCLAKDPDDRFENAKALLKAFESCIGSSDDLEEAHASTNMQRSSSSETQAIIDEMRKLRQEVETLRNVSSASKEIVNPPHVDSNLGSAEKGIGKNVTGWLFSNLNWLWCIILCITWILCGICIMFGYDKKDSGTFGAIAMCVGSACVLFPWIFKWESGFLNLLLVLLWLAAMYMSIFYTSLPFNPFMVIMGGFGFIGLCVVIISIHRK